MVALDNIEASLRTDTGLVRGHNEDFVGSWEPTTSEEAQRNGWLYIVADGVGGAAAGEVASRHATEQTIRYYLESEEDDIALRLRQALQAANDDLRDLADKHVNGRYMATTMVAAAIKDNKVMFVNCGDSRGYMIHNGEMKQITRDMSLVAQLLEEGAITEEEAAVHPRRNVILSSLGPTRDPRIDLFDKPYQHGDTIFLCSDGLTRHVSDSEIYEIVTSIPPEAASQVLIDMANSRGGSDNISVAIMKLNRSNGAGPRVVSTLRSNIDIASSPSTSSSRKMWTLTAILALLEAVMIVLVWYFLRV